MKKIDYMVCPVCGRNRVIKTERKGFILWPGEDKFNVKSTYLLQIREGGGKQPGPGKHKGIYRGCNRGSGFHLVDGKTLLDMIAAGAYPDVLDDFKVQIIDLLQQFIEAGFIKRTEIVGRKSRKA